MPAKRSLRSNAFLPVFGVDGDAAVTCWESLVNLDVEFTVFHELFDFGDTCGVALSFHPLRKGR